MTAELVAFLLARLDEDEQVARAATPGPWTMYDNQYPETIYGDSEKTAVVAGGRWGGEASCFESAADAIHIARHDPARVLAEVDAKRRIIEAEQASLQALNVDPSAETLVLLLLALPYARHPDYQSEWAPEG